MKHTPATAPIGAGGAAATVGREAMAELRRKARDFVERSAEADREGGLALTVAAVAVPVEHFLRALPDAPAFSFAPAGGLAMATLGEAASLEVSASPEGMAAARRELSRYFDRFSHRVAPGALEVTPRALVGLAFEPEAAPAAPFEELGRGRLVLPRWTYWSDGARAALTLALSPDEAFDRDRALAELDALFDALDAPPPAAPFPPVVEEAGTEPAEWNALVELVHAALRRGEASKIVVSRRKAVRAAGPLDPTAVFSRIGEAPEGATRFFVRRGATTFLGCTPEHLFEKRGRTLETEALAGSIGAGEADGEAKLKASEKDLGEHARVVEHIVARLEPLCTEVKASETPRIRRLPTVLHLRTPIAATLAEGVDALTVVEALHPTPAVGGTPADFARRFIAQHEPSRGWYAAPIGFVDARGDAEFFVALRCLVARGDEAHLFAGAGIVAASEAALEWEETKLKMRPMMRALGVGEG